VLTAFVLQDVVVSTMLVLVCALAFVVVRYSRTYLDGDPGLIRYYRLLLATLAAITTLVTSNNLAVIAAAWLATSLTLHGLLAFYRERPAALVAAHKKFLLSRLADASMLVALAITVAVTGTLQIDQLNAWASTHTPLPLSMHAAALLLVVGVCLKSAQVPFHGWLTQVMEAPTPVSALLHAGIVNIGGFLMIRLAPLIAQSPPAQSLLVLVGMTTAVIASLVATTRISIKVALAWSTIAQMGFMLVECGLGAWHLALLHLVAHSLYKAHAFLNAGSTVDAWRLHTHLRFDEASLSRTLGAAAASLAGVASVVAASHAAGLLHIDGATAVLAFLFGLSLAPMLARASHGRSEVLLEAALRAAAVSALYITWHLVFIRMLPHARLPEPNAFLLGVVSAGVTLLFALQTVLQTRPHSQLSSWLTPRLFAGFYLDERFTRMTFRVWPPREAPVARPHLRSNTPNALETNP
jgi:NAD(P)H-quinone oxidoreductase subunit 5